MFIIDFRNKLVSNNNFSVIGNNNVDTVYLFSHFTEYASDYNVYLKVISEDETYVDKIKIDSENISIVDGALLVKWTMGEVSTQCKKIDIQLQFENSDGSIIAQTRIVSITLADTIDVDGKIGHIYPKILKELQDQIDALEVGSVAGYSMSFASDTLIITLTNANGDIVATDQISIPLSEKVDKVEGYGLSQNDFTNALKTKLEGIANGAQVNVIEDIKVNNQSLTPTNKVVNIDLTPYALASEMKTYAKTLSVTIDSSTYVLSFVLKDGNGDTIYNQDIDLPLETMVVGGSYDATNKVIILTLKNGQTISIPVGDIIDGLVSQTDLANALTNYFTKAEIIANYYSSESVTNLSTMAELRTFIDNVNARGEHCFFDLHNYINDAYVCIVHIWTENGIKYCFVQDLINHKTYGNYSGYADSDTIANYLNGNAMANIKVIKVTDNTTTLADIASLLQEINTLGDYVMFDVSSITHAMYLTTIFINGNYYRIYDSVTGRTASGTSTTSLSETLVSVIEGGITTPTTFAEISQLVQEGNASLVYSAGDNILPLKVVKSATATSSSSSLTVTCDMDDFAEKVSYSSGSYEFTYSSSLGGWVGSGEAVVALSEYGITVTGTPANGNVITVVLVCDELPLVVMGHNQEESANGDFTNSMTVATEYASDEDWQFDAREAFYSNNTGAVIPSGTTLHFTLGAHSWFADDVGKTFQLTLPVDLPVGGQLVWVQAYNATLVNASVQIFNSPTDTTVRGTATMTVGSAGTNLGTINNGMTESTGLNQCQRALLGNNDWEESAMRQGLSDMSISGWQPKNIWDRPPSWNTSRAGFLKHLQRDFLAVLGECNKLTEKVQFSASGISGAPRRITVDKAWLFSREEIQSESQAEYNLYPSYTYWHNLLGSTYGDWRTDSRFIMTDKNGTARYVWLRSPNTGGGGNVRRVYTTGYVSNDSADYAIRVRVCFAIK